jgi:hypothetical protein
MIQRCCEGTAELVDQLVNLRSFDSQLGGHGDAVAASRCRIKTSWRIWSS